MSVTITFSHDDEVSGRWTGEGRLLTKQEANEDLYNLKTAVEMLQDGYTATISIDTITQPTASTMRVTKTDSSFYDLTLPVGTFRDRGDWAVSTPYLVNDTFTAPDGGLYRVLFDHTSDDTEFDPNANDGAGHDYYAKMISVPANALPAGGATGMMLKKSSATNYAVTWGYPLPTGGTQYEVLMKLSGADLDADWTTLDAAHVSFAPSTASSLTSTDVGSALEELETLVGTGGGGGGGSIATLTDVVFATGDPAFGAILTYDSSVWRPTAEPANGQVLKFNSGEWTPTDLSFPNIFGQLSVLQMRNATNFPALGTGATITIDPRDDNAFSCAPAGDATINATSTALVGEFLIVFYQLTGSAITVTFGTHFKTAGTLSLGSTSGKVCIVKFFCDGSSIYEMSRSGPL